MRAATDVVTESVFGRRVDALAATWRRWADLGSSLTEPQWRAPTRCTGWDVAAQYAHVGMFPAVLARPLPVPEGPPGKPATAVQVLRGFNVPGGVAEEMAGSLADAAVAAAAGTDRAALVARYAVDGPRGTAALRTAGAGPLLPWPAAGVVVPLVEGVRIILMESVVHLLDVLDALALPPDVPADALCETAGLLADVADPLALIEAATGRRATSPLPVLR